MNEFANTEGANAIPIHTLSTPLHSRRRAIFVKSSFRAVRMLTERFTHQ